MTLLSNNKTYNGTGEVGSAPERECACHPPHVLHVDRLYALIVWLFPPRLSLCECSAACIRYLFLVLSLFQHQIDRIRSDLPPSNLTDLPLAAAVQP